MKSKQSRGLNSSRCLCCCNHYVPTGFSFLLKFGIYIYWTSCHCKAMKWYCSFDSYLRRYIDATVIYAMIFWHYWTEATATDTETVSWCHGDAYLKVISCDDRFISSTPDIFLHLPHDPEALHATTTIFIKSFHEYTLSAGETQLPVIIGAGQKVETKRLWTKGEAWHQIRGKILWAVQRDATKRMCDVSQTVF